MNEWTFSLANYIMLLFLIVPIVPLTLWYRNRLLLNVKLERRDTIRAALRSRTNAMTVAGLVALILCGAATFAETAGYTIPGGIRASTISMVAFHLVWWPFVMPVVSHAHRMVNGDNPVRRPGVRMADLQPRRLDDYLPGYWRMAAGGLALAGTLGVGSWIVMNGNIDSRMVLMAAAFAFVGVVELILWFWLMNVEVSHAPDYADLDRAAAEELRAFRVRGFFWSLMAMSGIFFFIAIACIEVGRGTLPGVNLGIVGGVLGTAVGMMGAAFGIACSLKSSRLRSIHPVNDRSA